MRLASGIYRHSASRSRSPAWKTARAGKKKVNLVISLPGNSGILNEATGKVDVGFLAVATNAKGEKVGSMNEGAGGKFPPEAVAQIKGDGIPAETFV